MEGSDGRWSFDPDWLYKALVRGEVRLSDDFLQETFLDYIEKQQRAEFYNCETGSFIYVPVAKRGNLPYAVKKGKVRDELSEAIEASVLDEPVPGFRGLRRTRLLFATLTFDPRKYTAEEAWASLKSTRPEGASNDYGVVNRFDANISKILGSHGKLVSKEAQANGYPAPHVLFLLDEPVLVRRRKVKGDIAKWYIDDEAVLKRLGKDRESRALVRADYRGAIDSNPVWKHGFYDIVGVVSGQRFNGRRNVCSYLFKYMSKCLTKDRCAATSSLATIKDAKDHNLLVALYTHYCNKCFRNRDITYGKGFKDRIGLAAKRMEDKERSPWVFLGLVDEPEFSRLERPSDCRPPELAQLLGSSARRQSRPAPRPPRLFRGGSADSSRERPPRPPRADLDPAAGSPPGSPRGRQKSLLPRNVPVRRALRPRPPQAGGRRARPRAAKRRRPRAERGAILDRAKRSSNHGCSNPQKSPAAFVPSLLPARADLLTELPQLLVEGPPRVRLGMEVPQEVEALLVLLHEPEHVLDGHLDELLVVLEEAGGGDGPRYEVVQPPRDAYQDADVPGRDPVLAGVAIVLELPEHALPHVLAEEDGHSLLAVARGVHLLHDLRRFVEDVVDVLADGVGDEVRARGVGSPRVLVDALDGDLREPQHDLLRRLAVRRCNRILYILHDGKKKLVRYNQLLRISYIIFYIGKLLLTIKGGNQECLTTMTRLRRRP